MTIDVSNLVETALGLRPVEINPLSGGEFAQVYKIRLPEGTIVIAKVDNGRSAQLEIEGYMLRYLAQNSHLPVPGVLYCDAHLLIQEFLPGRSVFDKTSQSHAAELLADLHNISSDAFGLERDTLIGGLHQPNSWTVSWLDFFRQQRLLFMGQEALDYKRLPYAIFSRLCDFCDHLDQWLSEPENPSLIHGDAWGGNILAENGQITGFLDPAVYYADAEIELAFTTLFGTFGEAFFNRYGEIRPLKPGFMETRRDIYNLYPLLVHVRLFGGSYISSVDQTLSRFGH